MNHAPQNRARGFTLVELMIAVMLAMVITGAMAAVFVGNSRARQALEAANEQIENGRYALQVLADDLQHAGYLGQFNIRNANFATPAMPDVCLVPSTPGTLNQLTADMILHIQGFDNGVNAPACIANVAPNTDIVVMRRVSTCVAGTADCAIVAGAPYFQASACGGLQELGSLNVNNWFRLNTSTAAGIMSLTQRDCLTPAVLRRYLTVIYYVANDDPDADPDIPPVPTLMRSTLGAGGFTALPVANGIQDLQLEYGIDNAPLPAFGNPERGDGYPDAFTADPNTFGGCAGVGCALNWRDVVSVKINLLARNTRPTPGYADDKVYFLGFNADGSQRTVGPFNDLYRRHAYQTQVRLINPTGRKGS